MRSTHYLVESINVGSTQPQTLRAGDPVRITPTAEGRWVSITGRAYETGVVHRIEQLADIAARQVGGESRGEII